MEPTEVRISQAINVSGLHRGEPVLYFLIIKHFAGARSVDVPKKFWTKEEAQGYALQQWPNAKQL